MKNIKNYESFQIDIQVDVKNVEDGENNINPNIKLISPDDAVELINQSEEETAVEEEPNIEEIEDVEDDSSTILNIADFMKSFAK